MRTYRNRIEIDGDVIRRFPVHLEDQLQLTQAAARQEAARQAGLPVPAIIGVVTGGTSPHLVMERVRATPVVETDLDPRAERHLGAELARFAAHMRSVTAWADPDPDPDWATLWQVLARVAPTPECLAAAEVAAAVRTTLVHGDLSWGNLLVDTHGGLVAVIDWDAAALADPAMDWAALGANLAPTVVAELRRLTPEAAELDRRAQIYLATWPVQNALWRDGDHPWLSGGRPLAEPRL